MRVFQEEIFGPVVTVTSFTDFADAMGIANDTLYGLGAGVWSRDGNTAYRAGRELQAGRGVFPQSGGCCDGASPMCYPCGDFLVGDRDVLLGVLDVGAVGVPVWISGPQYRVWKHTQLVIDVVPGRGGGV